MAKQRPGTDVAGAINIGDAVETLARELFVARSAGAEAYSRTIESLARDCLTRAKLFYQVLRESQDLMRTNEPSTE